MLDELRDALGDALVTDAEALEATRADKSGMRSASAPLAVVEARDIADVQAAVRWAGAHGVPVGDPARFDHREGRSGRMHPRFVGSDGFEACCIRHQRVSEDRTQLFQHPPRLSGGSCPISAGQRRMRVRG